MHNDSKDPQDDAKVISLADKRKAGAKAEARTPTLGRGTGKMGAGKFGAKKGSESKGRTMGGRIAIVVQAVVMVIVFVMIMRSCGRF